MTGLIGASGFLEAWRRVGFEGAWPGMLRAAAWLVIGAFVVKALSNLTRRWIEKRAGLHFGLLTGRAVLYAGLAVIFASALTEMGFKLAPLWGAAGIAGVALGFASQNSLANLISGLFLIAEKPFQVGDLIRVGDTSGVVSSIDALSVKLKTFDNTMIRIPNESMLKSQVVNFTRFPIRRVDLKVGIAYKEDVVRVREILFTIAEDNPGCLREPKPLFVILGFGDSSVDLQFSVWARTQRFLETRNAVYHAIKNRFEEENVEIPFPHLSLYVGKATGPLPVRLKKD